MEENQDVEKKKRISMWNTFKENGISGILGRIWGIGKKIVIHLCFGSKGWARYKDSQNVSRVDIYERWKCKWFPDGSEREKNAHKVFFGKLFEERYRYANLKKKKNKIWNFRWKRIFVIILMVGFVIGCVLLYMQYMKNPVSLWQEVVSGGALLFLLALLCGIISKWLDVKRYQETWVRHSAQIQALDKEMVLYIQEMEPYNKYDRDEVFMLRIIDIWDKNHVKFAQNMEKNEKELMNIFEQLKQ